jgi:hypothetical protein
MTDTNYKQTYIPDLEARDLLIPYEIDVDCDYKLYDCTLPFHYTYSTCRVSRLNQNLQP